MCGTYCFLADRVEIENLEALKRGRAKEQDQDKINAPWIICAMTKKEIDKSMQEPC